jgi:hypothetical protein
MNRHVMTQRPHRHDEPRRRRRGPSQVLPLLLIPALMACLDRASGREAANGGAGKDAERAAAAAIATFAVPTAPAPQDSGRIARLPEVTLDTRMVAPTGRAIAVAAGGDLQSAIDKAKRGDVILLAPGATYTGKFALRAKPGRGWITIRTDGPAASLPAEGQRVTPGHASALAKLIGAGDRQPVVYTEPGASGYRLSTLEIGAPASATFLYALIELGDGSAAQNAIEKVPRDIILDRVYVHGLPRLNLQRCVALNSASTAIVDSWLAACHAKGFDSQAIAGWNGPGPFKIQNNYLEGAGENVMFGGADPAIANLIPSDIEIRGNHFFKPLGWKGIWTVKNLFEMKNGRRLLVEGNVFENNWADGQQGFAILFKSTNQGGRAPWSQTSDLTFRYNIVRCSPAGLTIAATESPPADGVPATRLVIEHNIFDQIGRCAGTESGRAWMLLGGLTDVEISHNTMIGNAPTIGAFLFVDSPKNAQRVAMRDNISTIGAPYGAILGSGVNGAAALTWFAPSFVFARNVIAGIDPTLVGRYPRNNFYPTTPAAVGFALPAEGDFRLIVRSQFKGMSPGGKDPGADVHDVAEHTKGVVVRPQ